MNVNRGRRRRHTPSTYAAMQATLDALAYIADGLGPPYPGNALLSLSMRDRVTVEQWATVLAKTARQVIEEGQRDERSLRSGA